MSDEKKPEKKPKSEKKVNVVDTLYVLKGVEIRLSELIGFFSLITRHDDKVALAKALAGSVGGVVTFPKQFVKIASDASESSSSSDVPSQKSNKSSNSEPKNAKKKEKASTDTQKTNVDKKESKPKEAKKPINVYLESTPIGQAAKKARDELEKLRVSKGYKANDPSHDHEDAFVNAVANYQKTRDNFQNLRRKLLEEEEVESSDDE